MSILLCVIRKVWAADFEVLSRACRISLFAPNIVLNQAKPLFRKEPTTSSYIMDRIIGFAIVFVIFWFGFIFYNTFWLLYIDEREMKREESHTLSSRT